MSLLKVNFIGAGKLGKTIAHLLFINHLVKIQGICNTSKESALSAIKFIGDGTAYSDITELPPADITFITTPDELIAETCSALCKSKFLKPQSIIVHCSGALSSVILQSVKSKKCYIASIHPMHSFASIETSIKQFKGTFCAMEGDEKALAKLKPLFEGIGSQIFKLNKDKKALYHASAVFASNYLITLAQQSLNCMQAAEVKEDKILEVIASIMQTTLNNLIKTGSTEKALTGPIARGDSLIIAKHLEALENQDQKKLYALLGQATLAITNLDDSVKDKFRELFNKL